MAFDQLMESFGRAFVPKSLREPLRNYLLTAGYQRTPYALFGILFIILLITTYVAFLAFVWPEIQSSNVLWVGLSTLGFWLTSIGAQVALVMFFTWSYLNLRIYNRTKELEDKLPEYLDLVVTNLRSGMSFDKSLFTAIRPEFGILANEVGMVSKKVMTGNDTTEALREFGSRYDSPILRRSIDLIVSEIESGGEIASVIDRVVESLRKTKRLKDEMRASVVSYMMFISIIVMVLSPILFALANTILGVILSLAEQIASGGGGGGGSNLGGADALFESLGRLAENKEAILGDFYTFSYMALGTIGLFAGMIVSIIEKGDIRGGIKYIPVFIVVTLIIFGVSTSVISGIFGALV